jgi:capsular exopolysaccharide synthesis family protein
LIIYCVLGSVAVAAALAFREEPTYRAVALINLEKEQANPLDLGFGTQRDAGVDALFLETETRLIRNREVLERAARRLRAAGSTEESPVPESTDAGEKSRIADTARRMRNMLEVRQIQGTTLVELACVATSPKDAADIANAVAESYIDWKLEAKFRLLGQASRFLATQIDEAKKTLAAREQRLLAFGRKKDILSADPQSNSALPRIEAMNRDLSAATADRMSKEAKDYELRNANADALADSLSNGLVVQMRTEQARLEREYAEKLNLFKPDWPAMQQLKIQIERGRQSLETVTKETVKKAQDAARADFLGALRREENLRAALQSQRSEAIAQNADAMDYNNLRVETEAQRALLDNLLKRDAETQVAARLQGERVSNIRIVESALSPRQRWGPSYRKYAVLGLVCGMMLGLAIAFGLDTLDRSLRTPEQVVEYLHLPVLGVIPAMQKGPKALAGLPAARPSGSAGRGKIGLESKPAATAIELLPHEIARSTVSEAYRAFRTSLLLSSAELLRSLVVTSAIPQEGKTATATNLAVVLAQLGKEVLLVDADLHRSRLHEVFHVSNAEGLVSVLTGHVDAKRAAQKTAIPGLTLLPAGPSSPNPSGLLASDMMRRFVDGAIERYDYVVIDAPPVLAVADAIVLGSLANGVILTVRGGRTPRDLAMRALRELRNSNVKVLGVLINALDDKNGASDRERYGGAYYPAAEPVPGEAATPPAGKAV